MVGPAHEGRSNDGGLRWSEEEESVVVPVVVRRRRRSRGSAGVDELFALVAWSVIIYLGCIFF